MNVHGHHYRSIWIDSSDRRLTIIDQTALPHRFELKKLDSVADVCRAIREMEVRGAGLIGATAAYGVWIAVRSAPEEARASAESLAVWLNSRCGELLATRPTASNLAWAVRRMRKALAGLPYAQALEQAENEAQAIADEDAEFCRRLGQYGKDLILALSQAKGGDCVHILTHCNAGWLAFVDYGSALAPIYAAHDEGIAVHVWVDETRPRNQGASLTAWELGKHGVPHDLIVDNAGGHLMQHGMVDMVITGADRVSANGDAANKIGTYLKALAAHDNNIPLYIALPSSTFDFNIEDGVRDIPIEERDPAEVRVMHGLTPEGREESVLICPPTTSARNWSFDVTPARLITGLITERGVCPASREGINSLYPNGHND